jgi:ketosteroid isomerase-like protein
MVRPVTDQSNLSLIDELYAAFARRDGTAMAQCYAPDATFSDPVFVGLREEEPGGMWRMLTSRSTDLTVDLVSRDAGEAEGSARWVAHYTFAQTGRPVVNDVRSTFRFADGLIVAQVDDFDFYRWSRQALGPPGFLLGWTPILRRSVQRKARAGLDAFLAAH